MLRVKNNNIYVSQGETATLNYLGIRRDGSPYILAPRTEFDQPLENRTDYAVLAFVVCTSVYGKIVLEKYLDLEDFPMYDGETDHTSGGFHKFNTNEIAEVSLTSQIDDPRKLYKYQNTYVTLISGGALGVERMVKPYQFRINIPFTWQELKALAPQEYVYDLILYYGKLTPEELAYAANPTNPLPEGFPLQQDNFLQKIPLVTGHSFTVEASSEPQ